MNWRSQISLGNGNYVIKIIEQPFPAKPYNWIVGQPLSDMIPSIGWNYFPKKFIFTNGKIQNIFYEPMLNMELVFIQTRYEVWFDDFKQ
jgi:hypothetical protein